MDVRLQHLIVVEKYQRFPPSYWLRSGLVYVLNMTRLVVLRSTGHHAALEHTILCAERTVAIVVWTVSRTGEVDCEAGEESAAQFLGKHSVLVGKSYKSFCGNNAHLFYTQVIIRKKQ